MIALCPESGILSPVRRSIAVLLAVLACSVLAARFNAGAVAQPVTLDNYFSNLTRPDSPNHWLIAPTDFAIKPDAVAPVFEAPVPVLIETFKTVVLRSEGAAVLAESANGMHVVATTPLMGFKDDIRALFIPVGQGRSTIALYSASRVGYWDLGTNRRRAEDWLKQVQNALANKSR